MLYISNLRKHICVMYVTYTGVIDHTHVCDMHRYSQARVRAHTHMHNAHTHAHIYTHTRQVVGASRNDEKVFDDVGAGFYPRRFCVLCLLMSWSFPFSHVTRAMVFVQVRYEVYCSFFSIHLSVHPSFLLSFHIISLS